MKGRNGLEGHQEWSQDWGEGILLQVPGDLFVTWSPGRDAPPTPPHPTHTHAHTPCPVLLWCVPHLLGNGWAIKLNHPADIY